MSDHLQTLTNFGANPGALGAKFYLPNNLPKRRPERPSATEGTSWSSRSLTAFHRAVAMHLVQILLPRADNTGQPFDREDFDRVKEELASRFEGVTAYLQAPAEGLWRQGAHSDSDDIVIFEVMTEEIDIPHWRSRRAELERRFRQDKVIIRYMPMALV